MRGRFLVSSNEESAKGNIYADRSSLALNWLLQEGISKENFSLREVAKEAGISVGLVQRIFTILASKGILQTNGIRTAKRFSLKKPKELLESWLNHYSILKKCKIRTYASALSGKSEWLKAIAKYALSQKVVLALHSATEALDYKNTNLAGLELYILDPSARIKIEKALQLEPREKGYEILLIEPYYKQLLKQGQKNNKEISICPLLLTFLDLYHFPLRGQEQAEFILQRAPEIKRISKDNYLTGSTRPLRKSGPNSNFRILRES